MARKDRILAFLQENDKDKTWTTMDIAQALNIDRSNVSRELNQFVRQGIVSKTTTRPVRYCLAKEPVMEQQKQEVFACITGNDGSMKTPIEQAKSSILYPPKGLNCLITGQTGTGKTLFVHTMFQFAKEKKLIAQDKELTVFNCADYANNTELLMSHLFGYVKGAFTGAEKTTDGLIQQADGGMLFLDEVHRLPPEGQEMIFYFMDHGTYSRLGEVDKNNSANVRVVCATTDDPNSSLLSTFTRRIPIMIHLPSFHERPAIEQINLLKKMLQLEASRIQRHFELSEAVAKALIGSVDYGNVGQLKSNVQLVCARGFLNHMEEDIIPLTMDLLTPQIKEGIVKLKNNHQLYVQISRHLESTMKIKPTMDGLPAPTDEYELPYNLYELIDQKVSILQNEGLDRASINRFITTDINMYWKSVYQSRTEEAEKILQDIVDDSLIQLTQQLKSMLEERFDLMLSKDFIYAMSLHLSSFIKRTEAGDSLQTASPAILDMIQDYPRELEMAKEIQHFLNKHYSFHVPQSEVYYLATLLVSLNNAPQDGKIGIIVATHGNSTATSMASAVSQLLTIDHIASFDMTLDMNPQEAFQSICHLVESMDRGRGVLLLVDMGSLSTFNRKIIDKTGIEVRTIDMVTTAMVLEAGRKTSMANAGLDSVYEDLRRFKGYSHQASTIEDYELLPDLNDKKKAIVTICSTGKGTAKTVEELLYNIMDDNLKETIQIIPLSVVTMDDDIKQLEQNYHIIASVGIKKPSLSVPHLTLEQLLQGDGESFLHYLTKGNDTLEQKKEIQMTIEDIEAYLTQYYTFINPRKIVPILWEYCDYLERHHVILSSGNKINLITHLAGAIERVLLKDEVTISAEEESELLNHRYYQQVKKINDFLSERLNLILSDSELYYVSQIIDT